MNNKKNLYCTVEKHLGMDFVTNLQPPPAHWTLEKIKQYHEEAKTIYEELKEGDAYLANRLQEAIILYVAT